MSSSTEKTRLFISIRKKKKDTQNKEDVNESDKKNEDNNYFAQRRMRRVSFQKCF